MGKKRILIIDNRPENIRQPVLRLQLAGYEVHEAGSGREGLEALRNGHYELLILDSELPNDDGWDVLREVRRESDLKDLKASEAFFRICMEQAGQLMLVPVDAELRRPFSLGALVDAVRKVIGEP